MQSNLKEIAMGIFGVAFFVGLLALWTVVVISYSSGKIETVRTIYPANNVECVIISRGARSDIDCWPISSDPAAPYRKQPNIRPLTDAELRQLEREKLYD